MKPLSPFDLPDSGVTLLEASAGTGKTWTIVSLAVRLLIESELTIQSLLILTFTRAATGELKERLRRRLADARSALNGNLAEPDDFLRELVDRYAGEPRVLRLLDAALQQYDEASVTTIHGYCQRVLSEQAFSTGADLDLELHDDQLVVLREVVENFWREVMAKAEPAMAAYLADRWKSPQVLLADHEHHFLQPLHLLPPATASEDDYYTPFVEAREQLLGLADSFGLLKPTASTKVRSHLATLLPKKMPAVVNEAKRLCKGSLPEEAELGAAIQAYLDSGKRLLANYERHEKQLRYRLLKECEVRYVESRSRVRALCYQDFLTDLDKALRAPGGNQLAADLRKRYPIALVDEFQDTDPLQAAIFRQIYVTADAERCALYLVGDPKQAIYSFRGADIFAYLRTSKLADRRFALEHNWRSNAGLIAATNQLFSRVDEPFNYADIPFLPVAAAQREQILLSDPEAPVSGLTLWQLPTGMSAGGLEELTANATADEVHRLLGSTVRIDQRPIVGRDIAILVRSHHQAALVRASLSRRGIASVSRGGASVFETQECAELLQVMRAVAAPRDMALVKGALATPLFGWKAAAILELNVTPSAWQAPAARFLELEALWRKSGVANMLMSLMRATLVSQRALAGDDGHRRMTNYRHLIELLDEQARSVSASHNPFALIDWVVQQQQVADPPEERLLRLETDEDLVTVITLHASKGLEFGVVFCPFLFRRIAVGNALVTFHDPDADNRATLQIDTVTAAQKALALTEEKSEAMRLAYVALTRAQYRCYAVLHTATSKQDNVFCPIRELALPGLQGSPEATEVCVREHLDLFSTETGSNWVPLTQIERPDSVTAPVPGSKALLPKARVLQRTIDRRWGVTSFSALHHQRDLSGDAQDFDLQFEPAAAGADSYAQEIPGGVRTGIILHHLLEEMDFEWHPTEIDAYIASELAQPAYAFLPAEPVAVLLNNVLRTRLGGPLADIRLCDISRQQRVDEMGFYFSVEDLGPKLTHSLRLAQGAQGAVVQTPLQEGFIRGFIDLVFEYQGRYYLADYKSNLLPDNRYDSDAMAHAMTLAGYDIQAMIYAQALHRLLASRLPDYDHSKHFGGVYYLFLRGMIPTNSSGYGAHFQYPSLDALHAFDRCSEEL